MTELEKFKRLSAAGDVDRLSAFQAHSAYDLSRISDSIHAMNEATRKENELKHKAALATIELNESTKQQNQMLRAQLEKMMEARRVSERYEYDVFVSHANANKQSFVDSLYEQLNRLRIRIWYDSTEIDWGDGLKEKIQEGLSKCRFGIVILSPEFIDRKWTNQELTELLTRQNESREKVVLPLLYNLTVDEMKAQYPVLENIKARLVRNDEDAKDVVIDFARILIRSLKFV